MFPQTNTSWSLQIKQVSLLRPSYPSVIFLLSSGTEMGGEKQVYQGTNMKRNGGSDPRHVQWVIIESENDNICDSDSFESAGSEGSTRNSEASSSSSDMVEDASSSPPSDGPLYELSELMNQLPIKRGLSKFYQGKSQSFTSLADVSSLEELAKKVSPYSHRMKSCKSYAGFDVRKVGPKATITKKSSRGSFLSSLGSRGNFVRQL